MRVCLFQRQPLPRPSTQKPRAAGRKSPRIAGTDRLPRFLRFGTPSALHVSSHSFGREVFNELAPTEENNPPRRDEGIARLRNGRRVRRRRSRGPQPLRRSAIEAVAHDAASERSGQLPPHATDDASAVEFLSRHRRHPLSPAFIAGLGLHPIPAISFSRLGAAAGFQPAEERAFGRNR
jgi:hypothetical protein